MRDLVAFSAFRELGHDAGGMRCTVAFLALRNHLVLLLMAECARKGAVLDLARREGLQNAAVTCAAVF